jgi:hypothetical protein
MRPSRAEHPLKHGAQHVGVAGVIGAEPLVEAGEEPDRAVRNLRMGLCGGQAKRVEGYGLEQSLVLDGVQSREHGLGRLVLGVAAGREVLCRVRS